MIPVVTPEEMAGVDAAASAATPITELISRAGAAVAGAAVEMLASGAGGRVSGARVVVVAGQGNNGADGRSAADRLARRGARVTIVPAGTLAVLPPADLVIDAAYGTGLRRPYAAPGTGGAPVLAVDIPSGLSGVTGVAVGQAPPVRATRTVTFAALKPGLLLGSGPEACGQLELAGIGLSSLAEDVASMWLVTDADVASLLAPRPHDAHKWQTAVQVVAGSPGMTGAPWLASRTALRAGAGYVRLGMPGVALGDAPLPPGELVGLELPASGWDAAALEGLSRFRCLVVGPGLGPNRVDPGGEPGVGTPVARLALAADVPVVIDADGLNALGGAVALRAVARGRSQPTIVTPHAGEYARLAGAAPGEDRVASARQLAADTGAIVLLKGSTTIVASPSGRVLLAAAGSSRLATAGTGDALSGVIGAFLARGVDALEAAALAAHVHGRASGLGRADGLVASDLPDLVSDWLSRFGPAGPSRLAESLGPAGSSGPAGPGSGAGAGPLGRPGEPVRWVVR